MIFKNQDAFYSQNGTVKELKAIGLIENTDKRDKEILHNLAIIGNNAYYIEPQTGEIAFAAQLD